MDLKKVSVFLLSGFYVLAGINHFLNPDFYLALIPDYLGNAEVINIISGALEVLLGFGVLFPKTRRISAISLVIMLVCFIPAHVYFIEIGSCIDESLCVPEWVSWARLIVIHPLLMYWAWSVCGYGKKGY